MSLESSVFTEISEVKVEAVWKWMEKVRHQGSTVIGGAGFRSDRIRVHHFRFMRTGAPLPHRSVPLYTLVTRFSWYMLIKFYVFDISMAQTFNFKGCDEIIQFLEDTRKCADQNKKLVSKRPQPKQTFSTSGAMTSSKEDTNCLADPSGYFQNYFHAWP